MSRFTLIAFISLLSLSGQAVGGDQILVRPATVMLVGPESTQQVIVSDASGRDLTRDAEFLLADTHVVGVNDLGQLSALADGATTLLVRWNDAEAKIPVTVSKCANPTPISFRHQVVPILSKAGCNSGGCHGKAEGQNGFQLSVFGFDSDADFDAITRQGRGRRVSVSSPRKSLLLTKATAETPHGGGQKILPGSLWFDRLHRWIAEGAKNDAAESSTLVAIEVEPSAISIAAGGSQQLRVTAVDSAGNRRCVTREAEFESNASEIAGVNTSGLVTVGKTPGEAGILVRFMEQVAVCRVTLPTNRAFARFPESNFIDKHSNDKLQRLGIPPSEVCDDATFLRRVHLDVIGRLPTADETRQFLSLESPDKRLQLIRRLLDRDEYADYWALKWADILRVDQAIVTSQGAVAMTRWLRKQLANNTPYDQFAKQIVTARGDTLAESPASFYRVHKDAEMSARAVSQVFLGVRLECAQCHHHPAEMLSQKDYYAFANLFSDVARPKSASGGQKIVRQQPKLLSHPRTSESVSPAPLASEPIDETSMDYREDLADWMTHSDNPYFAKMFANRLWAHYFGRGLVEPIDDLRATNPATNEALLDALADHLRDVDFDIKRFTETLLSSRTYQLASKTIDFNQDDEQNYSHAYWKSLPAEFLLDAICDVTGVPQQFNGWPSGTRAIQIWDNRMPSYFFRVFGRPQRVTVCECERGSEPSIAQALHLMNSDETNKKIRHRDGLANQLAKSTLTDDEIIEHLYLATLSRYPSDKERALMVSAFADSNSRRAGVEDILWTLLNTREFVFNH